MRRMGWCLVAVVGVLAGWPGLAGADDPAKPGDGKEKVVTLDGLKSRVPADWKEEKPGNQMRVNQFKIPKVKGDPADAELVIFFFGPGGGGSAEDNVRRWKGMFLPPEGKKIDDVANVTKMKVGDVDVTYLDVQGTYKFKERPFDPNAKEERRPDYRMLGVVFASKNGPYFFRLVGPAKTVTEHKKEFDKFLRGFK